MDGALQALEDLKGDLPQRVMKLKQELDVLKSDHETKNIDLAESKQMQLHLEGENTDLEEKLHKYQDQLYAVTTNREYDAITVEIDTIQEKVSDVDTQILELIDKEKNLSEDIIKSISQIEMLEENLKMSEQKLNKKIKITESEYKDWKKKRSELISQIRKPVLYQYERIRKVKGKTAVVEINKYICGGCFSTIPPQKVVEVRNMDQLILCESCGRILVGKNNRGMVEK